MPAKLDADPAAAKQAIVDYCKDWHGQSFNAEESDAHFEMTVEPARIG